MSELLNTNSPKVPLETCECGNKIWTQGLIIKKISALLSQSGTEEFMPIPVFLCSKCGELAPMYKNDKKFNELIG
jgi:hypothetical protein